MLELVFLVEEARGASIGYIWDGRNVRVWDTDAYHLRV